MQDDKTEIREMGLRPATLDDVNIVAAIDQRVFTSSWSPEHFAAELEKPYSHFMVMTDEETDSVIGGYIVYWVLLKECQILTLAVDVPFRGLGLARRMLQHAINLAIKEGANRALLDVRVSNFAALQLYQSLGFTVACIRKGFYPDGEDAYQMALPIKEDGLRF